MSHIPDADTSQQNDPSSSSARQPRQWARLGGARRRTVLLAGLVTLAVLGSAVVVRAEVFAPTTITASFSSAVAIYPGDQVRVAGVGVGTVTAIEPRGTEATMTLEIDRRVAIPANASAVVVAQNLIAARYVQLTPAYRSGDGPTMGDGSVIPIERTAVPVEWDEVKTQLTRLATDLGPKNGVSETSVSRFIDSAANAMDGNGDKLRQTLSELSGVGRILADGSGNIVDIIKNLQTFVTALRDSNTQIVSFQDRLATLSSVLDGSRSDLDSAVTNLSAAVGEVQRFIAETRGRTSEQLTRLSNVTQTVVDHKISLENILHAAPNAFANAYNIYNPDIGAPLGNFVLNNLSSPISFICGAIGAVENVTAPETAKLCAQYLGPALRLFNFNYLPIPINPYLSKSLSPSNIVYSDPALAPGGAGAPPGPPDQLPAVSAYTGLDGPGPPPPGAFPPGPTAPDHLPAAPSPALFPGAPVPQPVPQPVPEPGPATLPGILLPAEEPAP